MIPKGYFGPASAVFGMADVRTMTVANATKTTFAALVMLVFDSVVIVGLQTSSVVLMGSQCLNNL